MGDHRLITQSDLAEDIDWSRAEARSQEPQTGLDTDSNVFWMSLSALDFVGIVDVATRTLEAHGWETNLENILSALESMRLGRRALVRDGSAGQRPVVKSFDRVLTLSLPSRKHSGKLLSMLYALVSGSEEPGALRGSRDINEHPAVKALQKRLAEKDEEIEVLRARERKHRTAPSGSGLSSSNAAQAPAVLGLSAELGVLNVQVRSVDWEQGLVFFRGDRRSYSLGFAAMTHLPEVGSTAIGLVDGGVLRGIIPVGVGWHAISYVQAKVMAFSAGFVKVVLPGRAEATVPLFSDDSQKADAPKRHDRVVVGVAAGRVVMVCSSPMQLASLSAERRIELKMHEWQRDLLALREAEENQEGTLAREVVLSPSAAADKVKRKVG